MKRSAPSGRPLARVRLTLAAASRALRAVAGAPDYERYLAHMRTQHPDVPPLTRSEFVRQKMDERYNKPGARCC